MTLGGRLFNAGLARGQAAPGESAGRTPSNPINPQQVSRVLPPRINISLVSRVEQVALQWTVRRLPGWVTSDMMTGLGFFGAILAFSGYVASWRHPAFLLLSIFGLVLHWFGDSLDGTLARYRNRESPRFGFFVDNMLDAVSQALFFVGMGLSPYVRLDVAALVLCGYYLMVLHTFARTHLVGLIQMTYASVGPTEFRLVLIGLTTLMLVLGPTPIPGSPWPFSIFDLIVIGLGLGMLTTFTLQGVKLARVLKEEDRAATRKALQAQGTTIRP